jgi:hypothetical protein
MTRSDVKTTVELKILIETKGDDKCRHFAWREQ